MRSSSLSTSVAVVLALAAFGCGRKKSDLATQEVADEKDKETGEPGVTADSVRVGTTGSYTGTAAAQAIEGYRGAMAYFLEVNATGGVHGRKIDYVARDDAYSPDKAVANMKQLMEEKVFCVFNGNGSSVLKATTPVLLEHKASGIFAFGSTNGAPFTREPPGVDVWFQVHASYKQEGEALVDALVAAGFKKIGVFYQNDDFGKAGLDGIKAGMAKHKLTLAVETHHPPSQKFDASTKEQVEALKKAGAEAVISFTLYQPAAGFVRDARDNGFNGPIANSSIANDTWLRFLASHEKKEREKNPNRSYLDKPLFNIHSVPNWEDETIPVVREFRTLMDKRNPQVPEAIRDANYRTLPYQTISFLSFVNAKVFVEGMKRAGPNLTRKAMREALEKLTDYDPGFGIQGMTVTFSPTRHQGLDKMFYVGVEGSKWVSLQDPTPYLRGKAPKAAGAKDEPAKDMPTTTAIKTPAGARVAPTK